MCRTFDFSHYEGLFYNGVGLKSNQFVIIGRMVLERLRNSPQISPEDKKANRRANELSVGVGLVLPTVTGLIFTLASVIEGNYGVIPNIWALVGISGLFMGAFTRITMGHEIKDYLAVNRHNGPRQLK